MSREKNFLISTIRALGRDLVKKIQEKRFCVIGCGGVGANFAEMLVRSGAERISLIDADKIEEKNLNRIFCFCQKNIDTPKVETLKKKLESINPNINVNTHQWNLKEQDHCIEDKDKRKNTNVISTIREHDYILIAVDNNRDRIQIEKICENNNNYFSVGIGIEKDIVEYHCIWKPKTPKERKEVEGYGSSNGSYAAIVIEATAVGFSMLLHHLKNPDSQSFKKYHKKYINFIPTLLQLDDKNII